MFIINCHEIRPLFSHQSPHLPQARLSEIPTPITSRQGMERVAALLPAATMHLPSNSGSISSTAVPQSAPAKPCHEVMSQGSGRGRSIRKGAPPRRAGNKNLITKYIFFSVALLLSLFQRKTRLPTASNNNSNNGSHAGANFELYKTDFMGKSYTMYYPATDDDGGVLFLLQKQPIFRYKRPPAGGGGLVLGSLSGFWYYSYRIILLQLLLAAAEEDRFPSLSAGMETLFLCNQN